MPKMLAICGLDCAVCPAFIAHKTNDQELREKTAIQWSKDYGADIKPQDVNCVGCVVAEGVHVGHCFECEMRKCGQGKKVKNCAHCAEYPCAVISKFIENVPPAKANLEEVRASLKKQ
ncbi:MAG: DUF3795 domain-containing protein [Candidatus Edwardsbacteria bacterium]|nr:DUF3795 domain-containing protein [Candidatus Edwardsbacteria bacterium]